MDTQLAFAAADTASTQGDSSMLMNIAICAVAVGVGLLAARIASSLIRRVFGHYTGPLTGEASIVVNLIRGIIAIIVASIISENVFNVELGGLVQALGITALVVSLGLQDLIKNVVAGIQILLTKIFVVGDQLDVGSERGEVTDINWRQTTLRDKDGDLHVVPNATIMGATFMKRVGKMVYRHELECDIKPGLNLSRVADDIARLADETLTEHGWKAEQPSEARYIGSTANGVRVSIRFYISDIEYTTRSMDAIMRAIGSRGYLADWTNDTPEQEQWRS